MIAISLTLRGETQIAANQNRNGFYIWQRQWSEQVDAAVCAEINSGTHNLYFFGGEIEFKGTNALWHSSEMPERFLHRPCATTVFRLPIRSLDDLKSTASAIISRARTMGVWRIQLDADVPERKMECYAELLEEIRRQWPDGREALHLGATFLPCHLHLPEMMRILSAIDEPVIQLHGINVPKELDQRWSLMDRQITFRALKEARTLDARFKMALPSYAYILTFHADGRFQRLYAEGLPDDFEMPPGTIRRIAAPDQDLLCEIFQSPLRLPVIWFRLPVRGSDRWCLDHETLLILERGKHPIPSVEFSVSRGRRDGVIDLFACYRHQIPLESTIAVVDWDDNDADGEFFPLNGCRIADDAPYGRLPKVLSVPPSSCGVPIRIGTVITCVDPLKISIKERN